VSKHWRQQLV